MPAAEPANETKVNTSEPKILIIDDEQSIRKAMDIALRSEGYQLLFASDGRQGLQIFRQEQPDLVFLDLKMPVMDGYGFLEGVQVRPDSSFTLVVITGHGEDSEIEHCYRMGIDFFLRKPLNMAEICGLARRCIETQKLRRERSRLLAELQESRDRLERRVEERTGELSETVAVLENEIRDHTITAAKLRNKTKALQESNIALQVLLKQRDEEKARDEMEITRQIEKLIQPYLEKLKGSRLNQSQKNILDLIEQNLKTITSPFLAGRLPLFIRLTAKELQIANLIKQGMSSKEIAGLLDISARTVETHRNRIRKKIGLQGRKTSLRTEILRSF